MCSAFRPIYLQPSKSSRAGGHDTSRHQETPNSQHLKKDATSVSSTSSSAEEIRRGSKAQKHVIDASHQQGDKWGQPDKNVSVSKSSDINGRVEETRSGDHLNELEYDEWMKEHCGRSSFVAGLKKKFQSGSSRTLPLSVMPGGSSSKIPPSKQSAPSSSVKRVESLDSHFKHSAGGISMGKRRPERDGTTLRTENPDWQKLEKIHEANSLPNVNNVQHRGDVASSGPFPKQAAGKSSSISDLPSDSSRDIVRRVNTSSSSINKSNIVTEPKVTEFTSSGQDNDLVIDGNLPSVRELKQSVFEPQKTDVQRKNIRSQYPRDVTLKVDQQLASIQKQTIPEELERNIPKEPEKNIPGNPDRPLVKKLHSVYENFSSKTANSPTVVRQIKDANNNARDLEPLRKINKETEPCVSVVLKSKSEPSLVGNRNSASSLVNRSELGAELQLPAEKNYVPENLSSNQKGEMSHLVKVTSRVEEQKHNAAVQPVTEFAMISEQNKSSTSEVGRNVDDDTKVISESRSMKELFSIFERPKENGSKMPTFVKQKKPSSGEECTNKPGSVLNSRQLNVNEKNARLNNVSQSHVASEVGEIVSSLEAVAVENEIAPTIVVGVDSRDPTCNVFNNEVVINNSSNRGSEVSVINCHDNVYDSVTVNDSLNSVSSVVLNSSPDDAIVDGDVMSGPSDNNVDVNNQSSVIVELSNTVIVDDVVTVSNLLDNVADDVIAASNQQADVDDEVFVSNQPNDIVDTEVDESSRQSTLDENRLESSLNKHQNEAVTSETVCPDEKELLAHQIARIKRSHAVRDEIIEKRRNMTYEKKDSKSQTTLNSMLGNCLDESFEFLDVRRPVEDIISSYEIIGNLPNRDKAVSVRRNSRPPSGMDYKNLTEELILRNNLMKQGSVDRESISMKSPTLLQNRFSNQATLDHDSISIKSPAIQFVGPQETMDYESEKDDFTDDESSGESVSENPENRGDNLVSIAVVESADTGKQNPSKLDRIVGEILESERTYVGKLRLIDEEFQQELLKRNESQHIIPPQVIPRIFLNITSIHQFHRDFLLPRLEKCRSPSNEGNEENRIGSVFCKFAPFLKLYSEYLQSYVNASKTIEQWLKKSPKFAKFIQEIQVKPICGNLKLQNHMLEPVQRIPRYKLLLQNYLDHLSEDSPDFNDAQKALNLVSSAAEHNNDLMKIGEKMLKLIEVSNSILDKNANIVTLHRELVKQGRMSTVNKKNNGLCDERYLFLFNDCLLVCKCYPAGGGGSKAQYKIVTNMNISGMKIKGENPSSGMIVLDSKQGHITLHPSSVEEKEAWTKAIKSVIDACDGQEDNTHNGLKMCSGYLKISKDKKNWVTEWCVVDMKGLLYRMKEEQEDNFCEFGSPIPLTSFELRRSTDSDNFTNEQHVFILTDKKRKSYYFQAQDENNLEMWIKNIDIVLHNPTLSPLATVETPNLMNSPQSLNLRDSSQFESIS